MLRCPRQNPKPLNLSANTGAKRNGSNATVRRKPWRLSNLDAISIIMFSFTFLMSFIFSLLGLYELKSALNDKEAPAIGFFFCLCSTILWFIIGLFWPAVATNEMFVPMGWLWYGFSMIFTTVSLVCIFYILKYAVSGKDTGGLVIREEEPRR